MMILLPADSYFLFLMKKNHVKIFVKKSVIFRQKKAALFWSKNEHLFVGPK
jgi:hypothetical protein